MNQPLRILTFLILSLLIGIAHAFDAVGVILQIDTQLNSLQLRTSGADRFVHVAPDVRVLDADGKPLAGGLKAPELKPGTGITITVERGEGGPMVRAIRLGDKGIGGERPLNMGKPTVGFKPLTEMSATDRYKGEDGGLYGRGSNEPPPELLDKARKETDQIVALDAGGKPSKDGMIALVSLSMSNATQEFSMFKKLADADPAKSPAVTIVDCAQGGQAMAQWVDPNAKAWQESDRRLKAAHVSPQQVEVVWVKLANIAPTGDLPEHGRKLERDTLALLHNAAARFPNLRIAYLGSRIYGGYASTGLNPEPYAYESAFAVRWLIQEQNSPSNTNTKCPLLLWGPYFWGDGTTPRKADHLVWERADLSEDGTHPSNSGRRKVADMLLKFFKEDALARTWFVKR